MKNQVFWFCCVSVYIGKSLSSSSFFSCPIAFEGRKFAFDCASLDDSISHRNYFDEYVSDTCKLTEWQQKPVLDWKEFNVTLSSATLVTLKNCRLPILPHDFLQRLEQVQELKLDNSAIKSVNEKTFPNGWGLLTLWMANNDITELPQFSFSRMPNISEIYLFRNRIRNIDPNAFNGATNLKIINLSHNVIETIHESTFANLINLEVLDLSYNFIEYLTVNLYKSKNLKELLLANNKIDRLDCSVFDLSVSKILIDASFNHIRDIDFNCNAHLEFLELKVDHNQLTSLTFPKSNLLNGLTTIDASENHIESITFETIFQQLTKLKFNDNNLKELDGWEPAMFPNLHTMDIWNNWFNCSYLSAFLKTFPKRIDLTATEAQRISFDGVRRPQKNIHGINCIDDHQFDDGNGIDVKWTIVWCLLAMLIVAVVFLYVNIFCGKYFQNRFNRADNVCIFNRNGTN
ncbi:hypothetical protein HA402_000196 [Bradysia odoriphaga]|nr:hypothetical protein HA402_000196 [Bradysia odoriphaga]